MFLSEETDPAKKEIFILRELGEMCYQKNFDRNKAAHLIKQICLNMSLTSSGKGMPYYTV